MHALTDYDASSYLWDTWSDAEMHAWALKEKLLPSTSDAKSYKRHDLEKVISDNYGKTKHSLMNDWNEHSMKGWLVKHGVIKSDAQKKKEEVSFGALDPFTGSAVLHAVGYETDVIEETV
jgi:hypothetical protein